MDATHRQHKQTSNFWVGQNLWAKNNSEMFILHHLYIFLWLLHKTNLTQDIHFCTQPNIQYIYTISKACALREHIHDSKSYPFANSYSASTATFLKQPFKDKKRGLDLDKTFLKSKQENIPHLVQSHVLLRFVPSIFMRKSSVFW